MKLDDVRPTLVLVEMFMFKIKQIKKFEIKIDSQLFFISIKK